MTLKDYIGQCGEKPYAWAKRSGVPKDAVYRHLSGKPIRYESAWRISRATSAQVTVEELMTCR